VEIIARLKNGFNRDTYLLTGSMFIRRIVMGFLQVVRAIYFAILGFSAVKIGVLLSIATLINAVNNILFGYLCDKYGRKPFLILGTFMAAARTALFALSTDFWYLAIAQGIGAMGEGVGAGQPVVSGYIKDKVEAEHRSNVYSTIAITSSLAATLGLMLGGYLRFWNATGTILSWRTAFSGGHARWLTWYPSSSCFPSRRQPQRGGKWKIWWNVYQ
jgi:MFS family permease